MKKYTTVLTIAGSDCSGGAGIQADLKTFCAHDCYGMSVITAVTAQNTQGVKAIESISPQMIKSQFNSIIKDIEIDAIKIGMLGNAATIEAVASFLDVIDCPIVLDPVMCASSGDSLLSRDAISFLCKKLLPSVDLITPNHHEAQRLSEQSIEEKKDMIAVAQKISQLGVKNILIKGGDFDSSTCSDLLFKANTGEIIWFEHPRIKTTNTHGTGCTLSAAISCHLAKNKTMQTAINSAKNYVTQALRQGSEYQLGKGIGPVNHGI